MTNYRIVDDPIAGRTYVTEDRHAQKAAIGGWAVFWNSGEPIAQFRSEQKAVAFLVSEDLPEIISPEPRGLSKFAAVFLFVVAMGVIKALLR